MSSQEHIPGVKCSDPQMALIPLVMLSVKAPTGHMTRSPGRQGPKFKGPDSHSALHPYYPKYG
jgi:hypothetical protein